MHRTCSRTRPGNFWVGFWKDDYRVRSIWITWRHVGHTGIPRIPNVLAFVMGSGVTNITMVANIINIRAGKKQRVCVFRVKKWVVSKSTLCVCKWRGECPKEIQYCAKEMGANLFRLTNCELSFQTKMGQNVWCIYCSNPGETLQTRLGDESKRVFATWDKINGKWYRNPTLISSSVYNNDNKKKVVFADGLCHIMWFSIGHSIKTRSYGTKNDKI